MRQATTTDSKSTGHACVTRPMMFQTSEDMDLISRSTTSRLLASALPEGRQYRLPTWVVG